jgi:hypothetical protein
MGWASRRKEGRVGLIGEDGKPVAAEPPAEGQEQPKPAEIVLRYLPDGNLSIEGPADIRVTLAMLDEAKNIVQARLAANFTLAQIAQARQGVQKPGLRDVLAFTKVRP